MCGKSQFNHAEAMKLLELDEDALKMFIQTSGEHGDEGTLVRLLEMDELESDEVIRLLFERLNRWVELEVEGQNKKSQAEWTKKEIDVKKKYED